MVNGAVVFHWGGVLDMPLGAWRRQTDVILTGAFLFTKHVAQQIIDQGRGGSVINIVSTAGHQGEPGNIGYCTAKSGLLNFTRSVAMELSQYGIRVNSLTPTATDAAEGRERAARWGVEWPAPRHALGPLPMAWSGQHHAMGRGPRACSGTPARGLPC